MPEDRGHVDRGAFRRAQSQPQRLHVDVNQRHHAAEQMQRMRRGQHVKEGARRIRGARGAGALRPLEPERAGGIRERRADHRKLVLIYIAKFMF